MKQFISLGILAMSVTFAKAQSAGKYNPKLDGPFTVTKTIKVNGTCDMCEHAIEGALKQSSAVYFADWDAGSKLLLVKYNRSMLSDKKLEEIIAGSGHSTNTTKAGAAKKPDCCQHEKGTI